jgi:uncharacterized membrane protein
MYCHHCGTQIDDRAQFCTNCGQAVAGGGMAVAVAPWTPPAQVHVSMGRWLGAGWNLVMSDLGNYVLLTLVSFLLSSVPFIQGSLIAGFHIYTMKKLTGRSRAEFADLFKGFNVFVPALVASLLIGLFTFVGFLLLIIPGLVIAAMYKFTYLFIVDKRMGFWEAMQASHAVVRKDYFGFTMFLIVAFLVNVLGFLCLIVGLLVTVPMTIAAITIAYQEIVGFEPQTADTV